MTLNDLMDYASRHLVSRHDFDDFRVELQEKLLSTKEEERRAPDINIWGNTIDALKWNLDKKQEHIKNMFINILASDVNINKKSKVQPSFIQIVQQLSREDAVF